MSEDFYKISDLGNRAHLGILLNKMRLLDVAVEIGVNQGRYAKEFLDKWKGRSYFGVDPWITGLENYIGFEGKDRNEDYEIAKQTLSGFGDRVVLLREMSEVAVDRFDDETLDFVYIDANHEREYVEQDIKLWYPKVRIGGIIAGHDLVNGPYTGVREAVQNILYEQLQLEIFAIPGSSWSFYCVKK